MRLRSRRLLFGALTPGAALPFLLLPDGEGEGGEGGGAPNAGESGAGEEGGEAAKKVADMTAEEQRDHYKQLMRKQEQRAKDSFEKLKAAEEKARQYDALVEASRTEQEKALEAAKADAIKAGRAEMIPRLVEAEFAAAASGSGLTREDVKEIVDVIDATKFLAEDGTVNIAKVASHIEKIAKAKGAEGGEKKLPEGFPKLPQGKQGTQPVTGREAGLAEAKRRGFIIDAPATQSA